jgi:diguanylate cyclase (GGDEF)-like protein
MARILIIEDNPANMKLACLLVRNAGHTVLSAVDAETGLTLARADRPDLILMDIQLPGMDGLAATALLKQDPATATIPVIALTAMAMKEDQEKSLVAGCDAYIAKPLRYPELYAAIDTLLANRPASGERRSSLSPGAITNPNATILIVDDQIQNRTLLETLLRPEGYRTLSAASGEEALAAIARHAPDLILLDVMMPGMDGYQVAGKLKSNPATSDIPIIMVTAKGDRSDRLAGLNAGAEDFLIKPVDRAELWLRVRNLLRLKKRAETEIVTLNAGFERRVEERTQQLTQLTVELGAANETLEQLSLHDGLTGLANRRFFDTYLADQIALARRHNRSLALVMYDVDLFKAYNDHYGHPAGDECLKNIAAALRSCCRRPGDVAVRYGGEEFAMILPDTELAGAARIAEGARDAIAQLKIPHEHSPASPCASISGGVAVLLGKFDVPVQQLITTADQALYQAKHLGRNRIVSAPAEPGAGVREPSAVFSQLPVTS